MCDGGLRFLCELLAGNGINVAKRYAFGFVACYKILSAKSQEKRQVWKPAIAHCVTLPDGTARVVFLRFPFGAQEAGSLSVSAPV